MEGIGRAITEFLGSGNDDNPLSGYPFSGQTLDPVTSEITSRTALHFTVTFTLGRNSVSIPNGVNHYTVHFYVCLVRMFKRYL